MPNWCANTITITKSDSVGFNTLLTKLQESINNDSKFIMKDLIGVGKNPDDWYRHNIEYYGTKWDFSVEDANISFDDTSIYISTLTAWSPPINFLINLCQTYNVRAEIQYEEPGCDFCGKTIINEKGDAEDDCRSYLEGKYTFDSEDFFENEVPWQVQVAKESNETWNQFKTNYSFLNKEETEKLKGIFKNVVPKLEI